MKKLLILFIITTNMLFASESIHSSVSMYYENKSFTNSVQKLDAVVYGVAGDIHLQDHEVKFAYESGDTQTIKPKLPKDLHTDKLFLAYAYSFDTISLHLHYLTILHDNLAITDDGEAYGVGIEYKLNKKISGIFTQYRTNYDHFKVNQSDLRLDYKTKLEALKFKLTSITKYIDIKDIKANSFTKNADSSYLTTGLKVHAHYKSYHLGAGAYFGKRAFAIMDDGFKIQHHAMEFDKTYAIGVGKNISDFVVRVQYIYQKATELPSSNENVEIDNIRLIVNCKF